MTIQGTRRAVKAVPRGGPARNGGASSRSNGTPAASAAHARILDVALAEFAEHGYDGTRTAEIARRAGVTHPLVHCHFRTKEQLWKTVVDAKLAPLEAAIAGAA